MFAAEMGLLGCDAVTMGVSQFFRIIKGLQSFKISELLPQWYRIKWTAISRLLWYRATKSNISCDVWYRPYLSKYKKTIFSYSTTRKTKDNLKHVHKVTHVLYLPENLRFWRGDVLHTRLTYIQVHTLNIGT
jgi:hypothetical protein